MTIRRRLAALLIAAATGLATQAAAAELAFVINSNDASVSLLDVATHQEIRRIPLLREPHHMALSPDHRSMVIGDTAGNALFFLDPRTGAIQRKITVSDPYQLVFSPNGRLLTIAGLARDQIDIYDADSFKLLHRIAARSMPSHLNYSPDSSVVFVSLQGTDRVIAIETATGRIIWNAKVGRTPAGVLWNRGKLLVGIMGEAHFAVVDPLTGHVERTIPTGRGAPHHVSHPRRQDHLRHRPRRRHYRRHQRRNARRGTRNPRPRRTRRPGFRPRRADLGRAALRTVGRHHRSRHRRH